MYVPATLFKKHFNHVESFGLIQLFAWYIITAWYGTRLAMTVNVVCLQSLYNMALKVCVEPEREREWNGGTVLPTCLSFYHKLIYFKCVYIDSALNFIPGRHMVSTTNSIYRLP